jgi:hypothetical protein
MQLPDIDPPEQQSFRGKSKAPEISLERFLLIAEG